MEDTLRDMASKSSSHSRLGLNPCFNGRYSQRGTVSYISLAQLIVLILVLMEDTLRADNAADFVDYLECLNPCFNGRYSQSI